MATATKMHRAKPKPLPPSPSRLLMAPCCCGESFLGRRSASCSRKNEGRCSMPRRIASSKHFAVCRRVLTFVAMFLKILPYQPPTAPSTKIVLKSLIGGGIVLINPLSLMTEFSTNFANSVSSRYLFVLVFLSFFFVGYAVCYGVLSVRSDAAQLHTQIAS